MDHMKKLHEKVEERTLQWEEEYLKFLDDKEKYYEEEYEIRKNLSFKKVKPDFEYENADEYLEHLKKGLYLNLIEQKLTIMRERNRIYNDRDEREAIKAERKMQEKNKQ